MTGQAGPGLTLSGSAWMGARRLFGPLSLSVPGGGWTCLLGASGVGKSTLLRLFADLPHAARFEGLVAAEDGEPIAPRAALMAQDDHLLPWLSVMANVTLGARLRGERADRARAARLIDRVGLTPHSTKRPAALSGGERQRVALARTLMENRPIVLLDEPFSALDAKTRADMQELAAETLAGRTVLHVTHDPGEAARLAEEILILAPGGLTPIAPPPGPPPRAVDDRATLLAQGALLQEMRRAG